MTWTRLFVSAAWLVLALPAGASARAALSRAAKPDSESLTPVVRTEAQWKAILSPWQYHVMREEGTDIQFTGTLWNNHKKGIYRCSACGLSLFSSDNKFESGTGWPSFWQPLFASHLRKTAVDPAALEFGYELKCARCGGHLGHVFDDGPRPTGLRYCIDGSALRFEAAR